MNVLATVCSPQSKTCKTTRRCAQQDDMQDVYQTLPSANGLVLGSHLVGEPPVGDSLSKTLKIYFEYSNC